jgi:hypothetical protein
VLLSSTLTGINGDDSKTHSDINNMANTETMMMDQTSSSHEGQEEEAASPQNESSPKFLRPFDNAMELWSGTAGGTTGATALQQVQFLASTASESTSAMDESQFPWLHDRGIEFYAHTTRKQIEDNIEKRRQAPPSTTLPR